MAGLKVAQAICAHSEALRLFPLSPFPLSTCAAVRLGPVLWIQAVLSRLPPAGCLFVCLFQSPTEYRGVVRPTGGDRGRANSILFFHLSSGDFSAAFRALRSLLLCTPCTFQTPLVSSSWLAFPIPLWTMTHACCSTSSSRAE